MITLLDIINIRRSRNVIRRSLILALWAGLLPALVSNASEPDVYLTLENASIVARPPGVWSADLIEGQQSFRVYEHGSWHATPWISPSMFYQGSRGLGFDAFVAEDNANVADRAEVALSLTSDANALGFGGVQYVRFHFLVGAGSSSPMNWMLMHQVWQSTTSYSPPFAISVRTNSDPAAPIVLDFRVISDGINHMVNPDVVFYSLQIQKARWYDVTIRLEPSHAGDGIVGGVSVWIDKDATVAGPDGQWLGDWGYVPGALGGVAQNGDTFDIRIGTYRRKQPRRFAVFFDEIKIGPTAASVK